MSFLPIIGIFKLEGGQFVFKFRLDSCSSLQSSQWDVALWQSMSAHGAMDRWINPSWWTYWAISHSSQCSTTGVHTKGCDVCYPVYGKVIIKEHLLLIRNSSPCSGGNRFPVAIWVVLYNMLKSIRSWCVKSILHGGPIELFLVPANAPQLVY